MKTILTQLVSLAVLLISTGANSQHRTGAYNETHRPQIHFSPEAHWMNDPNGMVFYNNTYHLFYQYYPDSTVWGPMHWAHATTKDLVHWQHQPVALYPDSLGYIFSGSAVVDLNNTSGFGRNGKIPLVAIFTHHEPKGEKAGKNDYQNQSIAYSLDNGTTWTKYADNPVLKNPGIKDFRDPKVSWYEPTKKWIMTLATLDRITFYSSPNLKDWAKESEFGKDFGGHGGVWECPDLFPLEYKGKQVWVLLVSINPGGPNGGSATQYFTGQFDGKTFTPFQTDTRWIDYGPDNYAGVTWSNTGKRKIFLGWMSNWQYANVVPTEKWRSAMTVPRDLAVEQVGGKYMLRSTPVPELEKLAGKPFTFTNVDAGNYHLTAKTGKLNGPARLRFSAAKMADFSVVLSNDAGEKIVVGYEKKANEYYFDRTSAGKTNFEKDFAKRLIAPRITTQANLDVTLIIDDASVELFADNGLSVMTGIFFPNTPFTNIHIQSPTRFNLKSVKFQPLKSIWR
ncbi:glycoside hydrolase family 32 protein [Segetibacter sp. 3557_3]|uniref:glycoside hydrolase family 32 protein n=1 Tax=Segetibacter sp. 3557_3 TaxID=2547429 RepID=UPI001058F1A7|nr:glycoside hydrolase family 32 protein [Segetibacter sp. 3557_3]TDH23232.1 glycoside hydrolase family 32 protein [Segetibacter sp. 3557_3]